MTDNENSKLWTKLDKLEVTMDKLEGLLHENSTVLAKIGARMDAKDKDCLRQDTCLAQLKEKVQKLELNQAKVAGAAVALSAVLNYVLKGLGVQ
ncbi:hypothetical protein C4J81_11515 [Deltaproteobacteria bacterium Smac51]|nr:hypothetical protein C4J81_11515 [Deltaproteobacteria bacterium Smac51]